MKSPIKLSIKTEWLPILIVIAGFALGFYFNAHFPAQVAGHWNFRGEVDSYVSRTSGAFGLPFLLLGMYILFLILPFLDPKKERYTEFEKVYNIFRTILIGFLFAIYVTTGIFNLGYPININYVVPMLIGLLFIIMGNYMGKIKYNWFVGIKTPWTLSSENVWNKTHRVSGVLFIAFGFIIAIVPFLPETIGLIVFTTGIAFMVLGSFGISYYYYRQEKKLK